MRPKMEHALVVGVYRQEGMDCTLGGITSKHNVLEIAELDYKPGPHFEPDKALAIIRNENGYMFLVPWLARHNFRGRYAFGGNAVYSSDSRFPNDYPLKVHDRDCSRET